MAACVNVREFLAPRMRVEPELRVLLQAALPASLPEVATQGPDEAPPDLAAIRSPATAP
jgi:hypothetical protein